MTNTYKIYAFFVTLETMELPRRIFLRCDETIPVHFSSSARMQAHVENVEIILKPYFRVKVGEPVDIIFEMICNNLVWHSITETYNSTYDRTKILPLDKFDALFRIET